MKKIAVSTVMFLVLSILSDPSDGQRREREKEKVGGCSLDTVRVGTSFSRAVPPRSSAWIRIHSLEFAGGDIYRVAVDLLAESLDSTGVEIYSCGELVRVESGPCWPPYSITMRIEGEDQYKLKEVRKLLMESSISGFPASGKRPDGYGVLFITCGRYAVDWWTVWYGKDP